MPDPKIGWYIVRRRGGRNWFANRIPAGGVRLIERFSRFAHRRRGLEKMAARRQGTVSLWS